MLNEVIYYIKCSDIKIKDIIFIVCLIAAIKTIIGI